MTKQQALLCNMNILLEDGSTAESTKTSGKPVRLNIGDGSLSQAFETEIQQLSEGDTHKFTLNAIDAFGEINPNAIQHMEKSRFSPDINLEVGTIINFERPDGQQMPGVIRELVGDSVTVDFNHPLAGHNVTFELDVVKVI